MCVNSLEIGLKLCVQWWGQLLYQQYLEKNRPSCWVSGESLPLQGGRWMAGETEEQRRILKKILSGFGWKVWWLSYLEQAFIKEGWTRWSLRSLPTWISMILCPASWHEDQKQVLCTEELWLSWILTCNYGTKVFNGHKLYPVQSSVETFHLEVKGLERTLFFFSLPCP